MQRLARVNRTQAFLATLALVLLGLLAPGWFGALVLFALVGGSWCCSSGPRPAPPPVPSPSASRSSPA